MSFNAHTIIGTNDFTVSMWLNFSSVSSNQYALHMGSSASSSEYIGLRLKDVSGTKKIQVYGRLGSSGSLTSITGPAAVTGRWYHVAYTRTGTTAKLYVDGILQGTQTSLHWGVDFGTSTASATAIGAFVSTSAFPSYHGLIDEVAIWSGTGSGGTGGVLTAAEIAEIYNSGKAFDLTSDTGDYSSSGILQGYWRFEDNSVSGDGGTIVDSSGNGRTGTTRNGILFSTSSPVWSNNYSVSLDGANTYIDAVAFDPSSEIGTNDFTMSMWVKANSSANQIFWYMGDSNTSNGMMRLNYLASSAGFKLWASEGGTWTNQYPHVNITTSTGIWYNVCVVRSGTTVTLYVNGTNSDSKTHSSLGTGFGGGNYHNVGKYITSHHLDGYVDEYAIWSEALTSSEVEAVYNSGTPIDLSVNSGNYASKDNLVGYWRFENNSVNGSTGSVLDNSINNNTADLKNGVTFSTDTP